jgi:hypothetical protein
MRTFIALLLTATVALGQQGSERDMQLVCPAKTAAQINTAITEAGTDTVTFGFDGGEYTIDANVSFPSNISIRVYPGSTFAVSSGKVMDFNTNAFVAEATAVFTGAGTATGKVSTLYRWPEWGSESQFNIGSGSAGGVSALTDNTYAGGTVQNFALATVTNLSLNGAAIDSWDDVSAIVNTNDTFGGYPAITLTTNMITIDHVADAQAWAVTNTTFTSAFDGSTNTFTSVAAVNGQYDGGVYTFDLGANYRGIAQAFIVNDPGNTLSLTAAIDAQYETTTYGTYNVVNNSMTHIRVGQVIPLAPLLGIGTAGVDDYMCQITKPFEGRYINIQIHNPGTAGATTYKFATIKVWGVLQ